MEVELRKWIRSNVLPCRAIARIGEKVFPPGKTEGLKGINLATLPTLQKSRFAAMGQLWLRVEGPWPSLSSRRRRGMKRAKRKKTKQKTNKQKTKGPGGVPPRPSLKRGRRPALPVSQYHRRCGA